MAMAPYRYTSESFLSNGDSWILLLQWGLSSLEFCSVSSDNFFVFRCTWLVLTHCWYFFVYILFKKGTKMKNDEIFWKKINSLEKGEGVPLLNFKGGPGVPFLNFEGGGVPAPRVLVPLLDHAEKYCNYSSSWNFIWQPLVVFQLKTNNINSQN